VRPRDSRSKPQARRRPPTVTPDGVLIPLTKGLVAIVDLVDEELASVNWCAIGCGNGSFYAGRHTGHGTALLHRVVAERAGLDISDSLVDHRDGDKMNCRRDNLRAATRAQNGFNRGADAKNTSGAKGVSWVKAKGKWRAEICANGKRQHLGYFAAKEDASEAYRIAANELHGEFARTA
jgi:hypothetical protein